MEPARGSRRVIPTCTYRADRRPSTADASSVDLLGGVVHGEARPRRPHDPEGAHEGLGAVVTGAHGDSLGVEQSGHVVGMQTLHAEGHHGSRASELPEARRRVRPVDRHQGPPAPGASAPARAPPRGAIPSLSRYSMAAVSPTASAIGGVPGSKRQGRSFHRARSIQTSLIISLPPRVGSSPSRTSRRP